MPPLVINRLLGVIVTLKTASIACSAADYSVPAGRAAGSLADGLGSQATSDLPFSVWKRPRQHAGELLAGLVGRVKSSRSAPCQACCDSVNVISEPDASKIVTMFLSGPVPQDKALVDVQGLVRKGQGAVAVMVS
jgi:hypothetical protein